MRTLVLFLAWLVMAVPAAAQTPTPSVDPAAAAAIASADSDLRALTAGMRSKSLSDADLRARMAAVPAIEGNLSGVVASLTPRLQDVDARLAQLGPPPAAGQPSEAAATAAARRNLMRFRATIDASLKQAKLLEVEATQASKLLSDQLRSDFETRLWTRSPSLLDPALVGSVEEAATTAAGRLGEVFAEQARAVAKAARAPGGTLLLTAGALAALLLAGPGRLYLNRLGYRRTDASDDSGRLRRSALALWLVLIAALTPFLAGLAIRGALAATEALTSDFESLLMLAAYVAAVAGLLEGLGRALLSAGHPLLRLAPLPDGMARRLAPFPGIVAAAAALALFVNRLNSAIGGAPATAVAGQRVTVVLEIMAVGAALLTLARGGRSAQAPHSGPRPPQRLSRAPWALAVMAAWLVMATATLALLLGYVALAGFLVRETIWIATVLGLLFLGMAFADDVFQVALSERAPLGRLMRDGAGLQPHTVDHLAVLLSGLLRLALLLLGWVAVVSPFGTSLEDMVTRVTSTQAEFRFGQASISPGAVLEAIGLLVLGLFITRAVRGWLEVRYLPKTRMDVGVRASLAALFSYLGVAVAILLAFAYLGLSFNQIALFASALSVGIGFGLQSIIGNFVSGLILLVERPVKVGDWIAIGDMEGDVKAINIRATEIDMWDRSKLIVPNSELVSKTVRNVTHQGALGRVRILLRLEPSVEPEAVRERVLAVVKAHPDVRSDPAPGVFFTDIHDGALEFTLIAFVSSPRVAFGVKSQLLFQIVPDLRSHGMNLASPNTVVTVALPDSPETGVADAGH